MIIMDCHSIVVRKGVSYSVSLRVLVYSDNGMGFVSVASIIMLNFSEPTSVCSILIAVVEDKSTIFNFPTLLS